MDDRSKNEARKLHGLLLPVPGPRSPSIQRRDLAWLPDTADRPKLYVISTPPEVRARWLLWCAIRQGAVLTLAITFMLIAVMSAII